MMGMLAASGRSQARAADGARHTRLARKRLEHAPQELRAHSDAGIGDLPTKQNPAIRPLTRGNMRYHFAAGAVVLDAVAVDIQEDLARSSGAMNLSGVPLLHGLTKSRRRAEPSAA